MFHFLKSLFGRNLNLASNFHFRVYRSDVIIDAGANIGLFTQKFAETGAKVFAFEPNPFAFAKVFELEKEFSNLKVFQQAVWNKDEILELYFHENSDENEELWSVGSSLLDFKTNIRKDKKRPVQGIDFSNFVLSLNKQVKLVKMDIEGAEIQVINHLIDTRAIHKIEFLIAEIHDAKVPELKDSTNALKVRIKKEGLERKIDLSWH